MLDNTLHHMSSRCTAGCHAKVGMSRLRGEKDRYGGKTERRTGRREKTTVICRIERRSCFCPSLYPSVKNMRQDYVCSCSMSWSVATSIFHNAGATVFQLTVLCVIGRHRLLSPDRHYNSEGRNRSVFSKKNYRREFFAGKPEGLEREDFGLRVTLIKGLSRRCRLKLNL